MGLAVIPGDASLIKWLIGLASWPWLKTQGTRDASWPWLKAQGPRDASLHLPLALTSVIQLNLN